MSAWTLAAYEPGHKNYLELGWGGFTPNLTPSCSSLHSSLNTLHHTLLTLQLSPLIHNYNIAIIATYTHTQHHNNLLKYISPLSLNPWFSVICCITSDILLQVTAVTSHVTRHTSHRAVYCGDNQEIVGLLKLAAWQPCAQLSSRILYLAARC